MIGADYQASTACHQARPIELLVTLGIKNALNSARWVDMLGALQRHFRVLDYLLVIMWDYLNNRQLFYETEEGKKLRMVTAGTVQWLIHSHDQLYDG